MASYNKAEKLNSKSIRSLQVNSDKTQFIFCTNSIKKQN